MSFARRNTRRSRQCAPVAVQVLEGRRLPAAITSVTVDDPAPVEGITGGEQQGTHTQRTSFWAYHYTSYNQSSIP